MKGPILQISIFHAHPCSSQFVNAAAIRSISFDETSNFASPKDHAWKPSQTLKMTSGRAFRLSVCRYWNAWRSIVANCGSAVSSRWKERGNKCYSLFKRVVFHSEMKQVWGVAFNCWHNLCGDRSSHHATCTSPCSSSPSARHSPTEHDRFNSIENLLS